MTRTPVAADDAAELARLFGDPWAAGNQYGHQAVLAADEDGEMFAAGEQLLDEYRLNAEFVPVELGGRFTRLDRLIQVMREVFRHDPCLGLGYGASSFIASVNVWTAGGTAQRRDVARLLLGNRKVSSVYHELAHGNDFARAELTARPGADGTLVLNGRKEVITNARRADAMVVFARTSVEPGSRSHSQLLLDRSVLPAGRVRDLPRFPSSGMRGVQLGGLEFDDCVVRDDAVLSQPGLGVEIALRSFQVTRTALPAMAAGGLDTGLRATVRFAGERELYGRPASAIPYVQAVLADAFTDLLICDSLGTVVARSIHLLPGETMVYASAAKYLLATVLMGSMHRLSQVMGSRFYFREGPYAIFQKHLRDMAPAGFGHAGRAACLGTVLPQLPRLARRSWCAGDEAPADVFRLDAPLPPLPFASLAAASNGNDSLVAALHAAADDIGHFPGPRPDRLRRLAARFVAEAGDLRRECAALPPRDLTVSARPQALDLVRRYASVLAASACINVWRHNRASRDDFLADPAWLVAALRRLAGAGRTDDTEADADLITGALVAELRERAREGRSFDLSGRPLPG